MTAENEIFNGLRVGFALCGSFCTFSKIHSEIEKLCEMGCNIFPIMSQNAFSLDTRFGKAEEHIKRLEERTGNAVIHEITTAEPIGPTKMFDILVVSPCTGNTLAKLAAGITDTAVTMAIKSHLRNSRPVLIGVSTNDGLSGSAKNIGALMNNKNIFFIPYSQDDSEKKPTSVVAHFTLIPDAIKEALLGKQIQPILKEKTNT